MTDFRIGVLYLDARVVIPVTPLGSEVEKAVNWFSQKPATAEDRRHGRSEKAADDQSDAARRRVVYCRKRLRLGLSSAQKEIPRRQRRRHIAENSHHAIDAARLLPPRCVPVHDFRMAFAHVLADQRLGIWQSRDNVSLTIGDQDRGSGR